MSKRYFLDLNPKLCVACGACSVACMDQNDLEPQNAQDMFRKISVVEKGSGKKTFIEGYRVGGKTGTAQKYEDGRIAAGKYVSSFVGFFPANAPKYLALVIIDEPQGAYYGSVVAAPCAKEIFSSIIELKNIPSENIP